MSPCVTSAEFHFRQMFFADEFFILGLNLELEICSAEIIDLGQSMLRCTTYYY